MIKIKIISVGKLKEKYYISAFDEYAKRLRPYCKLEVCEIREHRLSQYPSEVEIQAALKHEATNIYRNIPDGAYVIPMCIEGTELPSTELAEKFLCLSSMGKSKFCFIIGSSYGLDQTLKRNADYCLSMSKMTFPHQLALVMLAEQIYRAIMINEGSKYHK